jgi:predicted metal-dependent phosphoesterase TrpH
MDEVTRVDFHCHSTFSDGALSPRELGERLAAAGVAFAALTDHDTVDGLQAFGPALARRGVGFITGVEITVILDGDEEAHLLAYGFDPTHGELRQTLHALRQTRTPGVQSITASMRNKGSYDAPGPDSKTRPSAASNGRLHAADAIALIHRAGGRAFIAHPLTLQRDLLRLEAILAGLKEKGLDGMERTCQRGGASTTAHAG